MADTPVVDIKLADLDDKKKSDLSHRTFQENKVDSLLVKLFALQGRLHQVRFDKTLALHDKKQEIKSLASEINKVHAKLLQEVYTTTDLFEDQLELHAVSLDNIFRERNFEGRGFERTKSVEGEVIRAPSAKNALPKPSSSKTKMPKSASFKDKLQSPGLFSFFTEKQKTVGSLELEKIEEDVTFIRAAIRILQAKKSLSDRERLQLEDYQMKLRLRLNQRNKLSHETFHVSHNETPLHNLQTDRSQSEEDTEIDGSSTSTKGTKKEQESEDE